MLFVPLVYGPSELYRWVYNAHVAVCPQHVARFPYEPKHGNNAGIGRRKGWSHGYMALGRSTGWMRPWAFTAYPAKERG